MRAELERDQNEAEQQKAAALKGAEELAEEQKARQAAQTRISEVEEDLKSVVTKHDTLKSSKEKDTTKLKKLVMGHQEAAS